MNVSCDIIKDLLPLYLDDVCSNDSKTAVNEHIEACGKCNAEFRAMRKEIPISKTVVASYFFETRSADKI